MSKLKVLCFGISTDGFGAGPNQSLENPMGEGGMALHEWVLHTQFMHETHKEMLGLKDENTGTTGVDNDYAKKGFENIGSWILGRNMFGPIRGPWKDFEWKGWWGDNPPYHCNVYVLTRHERPALEMEGGTTFHFITDGIESALKKAKESAKGKDIRLGGGSNTVRQYLQAKLIDEMHFAINPVLLGGGENLFKDINLIKLGYELSEFVNSGKATHLVFNKK
ncbi:MAG: dihydrofolate reductase [Leptospiraceae bacterium]|nr:dihydrofolate reductase [Leptospiraceae bacterium]